MTRIAVAGASGKLGTALCRGIEQADELTLALRVAPSLDGAGYGTARDVPTAIAIGGFDVLVDVTRPDVVVANVRAAIEARVAAVIGTSGIADDELAVLDA